MARSKSPPKKSRVEGEIRKLQKSTDLLIRKAPFCKLVKGKWLIFFKIIWPKMIWSQK